MTPNAALLLVGAGGVAYYVTMPKADGTPIPSPAGPPASTTVKGGGTLIKFPIKTGTVSSTQPKTAVASGPKRNMAAGLAVPAMTPNVAVRVTNDIVAEVEKKARDAFKKLSDDAKRAGAKVLNDELGLSPPLDGTEDFDKLMKILGSAAGAAAGNALCGPICGKIGAVIGAYLGGKIAEWLSDQWGSIKAKAEEYYNKAKNYLGGLVEDAGDVIMDGLNAINPF